MKAPLRKEGGESVTKCNRLKMEAADGRKYLTDNAEAGKKGGKIAKKARLELESKTGKSIITSENYLPPANKQKRLKTKSDNHGDEE